MKKIFLIWTAVIVLTVAHGQTTFQKSFGGSNLDINESTEQTSDGGYIMAGVTNSFGAGDWDIYLNKVNSVGNTIWTTAIGGTDVDYCFSVHQTNDGAYVVAGYTKSYGAGEADAFLLKVSSTGNVLWGKTWGAGADDVFNDVKQTSDSGFILVGYTQNYGAGSDDVYLVKTDSNGNTQWTKTFGGGASDVGQTVIQTSDGGFILGGLTYSFGALNQDAYVVKTDSVGNVQWSKRFGGTADEAFFVAKPLNVGTGYTFLGTTNSFSSGDNDIYLVKVDSSGTPFWSRQYSSPSYDWGYSIDVKSNDGFVISGSTNGFGAGNYDAYLLNADSSGTILWAKVYGSAFYDEARAGQRTLDGGYVMAGYTEFGAGNGDVYLVKTDSIGNSGCNELNAPFVSSIISAGSNNVSTQTSSGGNIGNAAPLSAFSVETVSKLCLTVGQNEITTNIIISISPNPFSSRTVLQSDNLLLNATLTVDNYLGQTVKQINNIIGQTIIFHRDNLPSGLYFIRLIQDGKIITTDKLVITD